MTDGPGADRPLRGAIRTATEFEGGPEPLWYWCKGATVPEWFAAEVNIAFPGDDWEYAAADVQTGYARFIPAGRDCPGQTIIVLADGPGHGAFAFSYIDCEAVQAEQQLRGSRGEGRGTR